MTNLLSPEMVPALKISFSIIVRVAVETMQPESNVISTFTFCPSVILFTENVLLTEFCLVIPSTLNLYEAETIAVAVYVKSSPLQKVLLILPVTVNDTTGGLVTTTVIELVLLVQAVGSGLPATSGLLYTIASTE